ncbi:MAG: DUF1460 domain-containing protein [Allomuricauda sp.]|nr:MAG: DUF1460 domain-containing protein [Allomuricauda sp.]
MRLLIVLFFVFSTAINAQISCSPEDKIRFEKKLAQIKNLNAHSFGDTLVSIGNSFLGTPYVEKTLEIGQEENLVINLRGLDCTTFVENVLAFSFLLRSKTTTFETFGNQIKTVRYRDGLLNGYPSRLHYFTDWIRNNNEKGLVNDITADLGGVIVEKSVNFMGTHRELYPFLTDEDNFNAMLAVEKELANQPLCILPQDKIETVETKLQNGDIIALATSIGGLDVTHTGFVLKVKGRAHLLHASSAGAVTITEEPLVDYLRKIKHNTGIIVARPK